MRRAARLTAVCLAAATTLTLTACALSEDEAKKAAKERGFTVLSTGEKETYEGYVSLPVSIDSNQCSASFVAASPENHFLVIYTGGGSRPRKLLNPRFDDIKKSPQLAQCYPDRK